MYFTISYSDVIIYPATVVQCVYKLPEEQQQQSKLSKRNEKF
jgi:hypothetical protein